MVLLLNYFVVGAAAFTANKIIVVVVPVGMGYSLEQIEISALGHVMRIVLHAEQTTGTALVFLVEVNDLKNFEQSSSLR